MSAKKAPRVDNPKFWEESFRAEFEQGLDARVRRYLEIPQQAVMPNFEFSRVLGECILLYRDGYFFGCICLAQAIAEALVKSLCSTWGATPSSCFERNIRTLLKAKAFGKDVEIKLLSIWEGRDHFHHINPGVETSRSKLEAVAKKKVELLEAVISHEKVYGIEIKAGTLRLKQPKNWH